MSMKPIGFLCYVLYNCTTKKYRYALGIIFTYVKLTELCRMGTELHTGVEMRYPPTS